jgi:hypothetical protein
VQVRPRRFQAEPAAGPVYEEQARDLPDAHFYRRQADQFAIERIKHIVDAGRLPLPGKRDGVAGRQGPRCRRGAAVAPERPQAGRAPGTLARRSPLAPPSPGSPGIRRQAGDLHEASLGCSVSTGWPQTGHLAPPGTWPSSGV